MEKIKKFSARNIIKWAFLILAGLYLILVVVRVFHFFNVDKINAQVAKIHATKLTMADVTGDNLPPDPGAEADKTIQGIDANKNGIRDDVEVAIFKEYPNSAKTRAVLLQYALALQMETVQPFITTEIATEVVREQSRADYCVADTLVPRESPESSRNNTDIEKIDKFISFVKSQQLNTQERKDARNIFVENVRSFSDLVQVCDIDYSKLSN